jgi:hypothetical protein
MRAIGLVHTTALIAYMLWGCASGLAGCVKIWRSMCGRHRPVDTEPLLACELGRAKKMALVD